MFNKIKNWLWPTSYTKRVDLRTTYGSVTRVEVIDEKGRAYTRWNLCDVQLLMQDDGKTLKIFVRGGGIMQYRIAKVKTILDDVVMDTQWYAEYRSDDLKSWCALGNVLSEDYGTLEGAKNDIKRYKEYERTKTVRTYEEVE